MPSYKHILVTGGAGFIGSYIVDELLANGYRVRVLDSLEPQVHPSGQLPAYCNKQAEYIRGDVGDREVINRALAGIDVVIHDAAVVGVGQSMYQIDHYMRKNTQATATLLDVIVNNKTPIKKMLVASSMSCYGEGLYEKADGSKVRPTLRTEEQMATGTWEQLDPQTKEVLRPIGITEDQPLWCNSVYAISKKDQEELVMNVCGAYGIPAVALRYFNVFGPRQSLSNPYTGVAAIFMSRLKNGNAPVVYEDGNQTRDFVHVTDVAHANRVVMESDAANGRVFNVGTGKPTSIKQIGEMLADILKVPIKPVIENKFRKGDIRHCIADARALRSLGWEPKIDMRTGLEEIVAWSASVEAEDKFEQAQKELRAKGLA